MKKNYLLLCLSIVTLMLVLSVVFIVNKKSANIDKYEESVENVTHDTKANEIITPSSEDIGSNEIYENSNSQNLSNIKNAENVDGQLPNGIYRIEKEADGNEFYSNEFIIK